MTIIYKDPKTGETYPIVGLEGKLYDERGIAVIIPECCGIGMQVVLGSLKSGWVCHACGKWKIG